MSKDWVQEYKLPLLGDTNECTLLFTFGDGSTKTKEYDASRRIRGIRHKNMRPVQVHLTFKRDTYFDKKLLMEFLFKELSPAMHHDYFKSITYEITGKSVGTEEIEWH